MTGPAIVHLLTQRLQVVQQISEVQAREVLHQQRRRGVEFELLGVQQEITAGTSEAREGALQDARKRMQIATAEIAACDALCVELELRLEELDRQIAASRSTAMRGANR